MTEDKQRFEIVNTNDGWHGYFGNMGYALDKAGRLGLQCYQLWEHRGDGSRVLRLEIRSTST